MQNETFHRLYKCELLTHRVDKDVIEEKTPEGASVSAIAFTFGK